MAKLSEIFTYGGGSNTAPSSIPQLQKQNKPKLSKTFSYDYDTGIEDRPDISPTTSIPTIKAGNGIVDYKMEEPEVKQNIFQKAASFLGLAPSTTGVAKAALSKPAEDKRASQLATFDAKDKSNVLYSTPDFNLTQNKLNMWLDPSYQMSDTEKKQAKKAANELLNVVNYNKYFANMDPQEFGKVYQAISELNTKASAKEQFARGFGEAMPGIKTLENVAAKQLDKVNGNTNVSENLKQEAQNIEDTGAYKTGKAVSKMSQYYMLNKSGLLDPLTSKLGNALIPKLGAGLGGHVANILSDEVADIALDTVPEMVQNIRNGMSADQVKKEVLKNLGVNLAYNVGGEAIPTVIKAFKTNFGKTITAETAEEIIKNADEIADTIAKEAVETAQSVPIKEVTENNPIREAISNYSAEDKANLRNFLNQYNELTSGDAKSLQSYINGMYGDADVLARSNYDQIEALKDQYKSMYPELFAKNSNAPLFSEADLNTYKLPTLSNNNAPLADLGGQTLKQTNTPTQTLPSLQKPAAIPKEKNLVMAEDIGLGKRADDIIDDVVKNTPETADVIKAKSYAEPSADATKLTAEYNERGLSKHVVGEETPMRVKDVSDEVKKMFKDEPDAYQVLKNKDTKALADEVYKSADKPIQIGEKVYTGNAESKFRSLLAEKNPASLPLGHQLAKDYSKAGNHEMAALIYRDMGKALTEAGQFSQASIINMMKNDPLTALQYAQRQIKDLNEEGAKQFGKKWKNFSLTDDEIKAFNSIAPGNEEAIKALYDQIGQRLAKDYPTTFMEKLLEARKVAMLFNVRTNVRNFGANVPTLGLRWMSDRVEALGQNIAHLIDPNFKVTQSVLGSGSEGRKLAKEVFESSRVQNLLDADVGKYELPSIKNNLMKDRQMFKGTAVEKWINKMTNGGIEKLNEKLFGKKGVESLAETVRNTTYKALELGDNPFVKENFIERLGSYIKAQGIKNINDVPDEAIETAWEEAMKATYKDESWAVKMLRGVKKGMEQVPYVGKPLSQAVIPFLQAPGNIAARMVDYSPIRGTKGIADIIKGATSKNSEAVARGIEEVAKGLTGTGMILFGMKLKESGLLTGDYSEDKDEKNFQKQNGFKPWALHVGDKYITYDWAQPFAQNLMVGTLLQEAIDNSDKADDEVMKYVDAGYKGAKAAVNSWFNASPLQGLADLMKSSGYGGKADLAQNLIDVGVGDFAGALVPALVNATAKTKDTTQRNAYDPSSLLNTFVNQQKSKIPGLSATLPAKYDTWGNEIKYADSTGEAAAQRFLVPGDYGTEKKDSINDEINRLYTATNNNAVFPQTAPNKVGDTTLNNAQVSQYQQDMGKRSRKLVETLVKTDMYKHLDDDSRAEILGQLYGASKTITERDLFKKPVSENSSYKKLIEAYDNGGTKGMINYLADTQQIKQFKKEAGALRPDGSEKSLDKQELAVYLYSQGYSLDEINEWIEKGNFGKPYSESDFNKVIQKSKDW